MMWKWKSYSILPGFYSTFLFTFCYLLFWIFIPLGILLFSVFQLTLNEFLTILTDARNIAAIKLTVGLSLLSSIICGVIGLIIAWVLVRYTFPFRSFFNALIDLPFAIPTAVSGIALATLYSENGWIGKVLFFWGIKVAFTPLGILLALIFVSIPFVVRNLQPAIEEIPIDSEEAAISLGATRGQTLRKVIFPQLVPSLLTGMTLALARSLGEYGSVIFIAGNIPYISEIVSLLIVINLEEYEYQDAVALAVVMLVLSVLMIALANVIQGYYARKYAS